MPSNPAHPAASSLPVFHSLVAVVEPFRVHAPVVRSPCPELSSTVVLVRAASIELGSLGVISVALRPEHVEIQAIVRFQSQGGCGVDDIDIWSHMNEPLSSVRRQILAKAKASPAHARVELHQNGNLINVADDRRLISEIPIRDKAVSHPCSSHRVEVI